MKWRKPPLPDPQRPTDTGGQKAREEAERALADVRQRREETERLRWWFRREAAENHFGLDAQRIMTAKRSHP